MNAEIFDTHAHYTSHRFDADRTAVLQALPAGGVEIVSLYPVDENGLAEAGEEDKYVSAGSRKTHRVKL